MAKSPSKATKKKALKALDGVIAIAENKMMTQGEYITGVVNEELQAKGAICGGRQACLYGSLWWAAGYQEFRAYNSSLLKGVLPVERDNFMFDKPELQLANDALNEVAIRRIKRNVPEYYQDDLLNDPNDMPPAEAYFESAWVTKDPKQQLRYDNDPWGNEPESPLDHQKVIKLVKAAKKVVENA